MNNAVRFFAMLPDINRQGRRTTKPTPAVNMHATTSGMKYLVLSQLG